MFKITTITLCVIPEKKLDINLYNIAKYVELDNNIKGIKYNFDTVISRGDCSSKSVFNNQVTLVVYTGIKNINVKIFSNGTLQMSGCTSEEDGNIVVEILDKCFKKYTGLQDFVDITEDYNRVKIYDSNKIFSNNKIIGYKKNDNLYHINGKDLVIYDNFFISKDIFKPERDIYNMNGTHIGTLKMEMFNSRRIYKKGLYVIDEKVYNKHNDQVGVTYKNILSNECKESVDDSYQIFLLKSIYNTDYKNSNTTTHINCINMTFDLKMKINRYKLYEKLRLLTEIKVIFRPDVYKGLRIKMNVFNSNYQITFIVFDSGKVIGSGFKSRHHILLMLKRLNTLIL